MVKRVYVKPHYIKRGRKKVRVKGYYRKVITSREQGRSGERFKKLERTIYNEYIRKGYSSKRARQIARATAGKVFWRKYGRTTGERILRRER